MSPEEIKRVRRWLECVGEVCPSLDDTPLGQILSAFDETFVQFMDRATAPACKHDGDRVVIDSRFGLHYWCMNCGALKFPDEPSWTLPRPGRPSSDPT